MRSAPAARPGIGRPPIEFRVRFPSPMRDVVQAEPTVSTSPPAFAPPDAAIVSGPTTVDSHQADTIKELRADRQRIDTVLDQVRSTVETYRAEQSKRLQAWQHAAVELAATIATRLLHERVTSHQFAIEAKVRDMVDQLGDDAPMTIHLNPDDVKLLESRLAGEPLLPGKADPRVITDANLARGECRVEGRENMLLSDLTREVQEIRDDLLRGLTNARS